MAKAVISYDKELARDPWAPAMGKADLVPCERRRGIGLSRRHLGPTSEPTATGTEDPRQQLTLGENKATPEHRM